MPTATALNQRAKRLLAAAEALAPDGAAMAQQAAERIDLYDEHTFGYWDTNDDHPQAQTTDVNR